MKKMWAIVLQVLFTLVIIAALLIRKRYSYWSSRGVSGPRAIFPFGYTWDRARNDPFELETRWLAEHGKVYGVYSGLTPTLIVSEPELVRQLMITHFSRFANRRILNSYHPVWNRNLFSVDYDDWKVYRGMTTPAFSSGKLRAMNPLIRDCNRRLMAKIESIENGVITPKELFTNYSIDITSAIFFATETDAHADPQSPIVKQCLALADIPAFKSAAVGSLPRPILKMMGITSAFREGPLAYTCELLRSMVARQRKLPIEAQNDFVRLLIQTEGSGDKAKDFRKLTDDEVIAQCLVYFSASFEQIASLLSYVAYELALDQQMQSKLLAEIKKVLGEAKEGVNNEEGGGGGGNDFEAKINEAVYLEAIIKEALRKYPPELRMDRRVSSESGTTLGGIHLELDTLVEVPTIAVHYNAEYWPDPWKFDPSRFLPENRDQIVPYSFIPFGLGNRNCIGMRFAYQVAKSCIATLLLKYRIEPVSPEKTPPQLSFTSGNQSLLIPWFQVRLTKRD